MTWSKDLIENITDIGELEAKLRFDRRLTQQMRALCEKFPMSVTRYYLSLIDWSDTDDPIRRMSIPTFLETDMSGEFDTSDEESNTVCQGVQHKYTESALILTTNRCFMYCRHCFRKRLVGRSDEEIAGNLESVVNYIREHTELTNVILSGGDAFTLPTCIIKHYLDVLSRMKHLDLIRIATRSPAVYPMRIYMDEDLLACLKKYSGKKQLYVVTQFNHPREITPEATAAIRALLDMAGYAAVKLGYTHLGFLGGMAVPAVIRYGYGFVQGCNDAGKEMNDEITVEYVYGNKFAGTPEITAYMDTWYQEKGVQVVFACGGGIYTSATEAAKKANGKVIGVDTDQAATINKLGTEGMTVTSAMKGLGATVKATLKDVIENGNWANYGGKIATLGLVSGDDPELNYVQIPMESTQWTDTFTKDDYKALVKSMFDGTVKVSDDTSAMPAHSIIVNEYDNIM